MKTFILISLFISFIMIGVWALKPAPQPFIIVDNELKSESSPLTFVQFIDGRRVFDGVQLQDDEILTTYQETYISRQGEVESKDIQCPIPMKDRVLNRTGVQCVWASIEMIGRWAEEPKLMNPPLTSRADCKSYSSPSLAAKRLNTLHVKFEQVYGKSGGVDLIKKAMKEGRGCLWGVPGHAMVLVHYDEEKNKVCWVDNSDSSLKIQTTTIKGFHQRWAGWILVVYADKDIVANKLDLTPLPRKIPIIDQENPENKFPKDYIPIPTP